MKTAKAQVNSLIELFIVCAYFSIMWLSCQPPCLLVISISEVYSGFGFSVSMTIIQSLIMLRCFNASYRQVRSNLCENPAKPRYFFSNVALICCLVKSRLNATMKIFLVHAA